MMIRIGRHSFAKKKMKRISAILSAFILCCCGHAQPVFSLGIDVGSFLKTSGMNISAGCGFSRKWSVTWRADTDISGLFRKDRSEYEEHTGEFATPMKRSSILKNSRIGFRYWPESIYEGAYLETGLKCTEDVRADCCIEAGYCIPICRRLCAMMSLRTDILQAVQEDNLNGTELCIGIYWTIRTDRK